jgi:hypothetical protein
MALIELPLNEEMIAARLHWLLIRQPVEVEDRKDKLIAEESLITRLGGV